MYPLVMRDRSIRQRRIVHPVIALLEEYGRGIEDLLYANLPRDLITAKEGVRYRYSLLSTNASLRKFIDEYRSVAHVDELYRYVLFMTTTLSAVGRGHVVMEPLYRSIRDLYDSGEFRDIVIGSVRDFTKVRDVAERFIKVYSEYSGRSLSVSVEELTKVWIRTARRIDWICRVKADDLISYLARFTSVRRFMTELMRDFVYHVVKGGKVSKSIRLLTKWSCHPKITAPLAIEICRRGKYVEYVAPIDMYTATVVFKSGLFTLISGEKVNVLLAKLERARERGGTVTLKLSKWDDIVQKLLHVGQDPIALENALFNIGYRFCRTSTCDKCPLANYCRNYPVKVK